MRIYFFCVAPGPPTAAGYEHGLVSLAEGFRSLGHEVAGNRNYWPVPGGWLIPESLEPPEAFDVVLISNESYRGKGTLPQEFIGLKGPKKVYVDEADGWKTDASSERDWPADLVLRAHFNDHFGYPERVRPWAFGLTNRMIEATEGGRAARDRAPTILCNFRVAHPVRGRLTASMRDSFKDTWTWDDRVEALDTPPSDPVALRYWQLTGRRHNPAYYERLKNSQGCLAFGGNFAPGWSRAPSSFCGRVHYKMIQTLQIATSTLTQFDSWRFWEALACGAITVHGPLAKWGARLPVMPEDGADYISFDPTEPRQAFLDRWNSCLAGPSPREWAIEHYAPRPSAERLIRWLDL